MKSKVKITNIYRELRSSKRLSFGEILGKYFTLFDSPDSQVIFQRLEPNQRISPPHFHTKSEEGALIISGKVRVWLGKGEILKLSVGAYIHFKPGKPHYIFNGSKDNAELLLVRSKKEDDRTVFLDDNLKVEIYNHD